MTAQQGIRRKAHFLGTKIKGLRKRNNLTLEDLSVRCVQIDPEAGPSVSYLSMIENGKRTPSERLLEIIAEIFQKNPNWFFDESLDEEAIDTAPEAPVSGMPLEPGFLFYESLLQLAIPELLSQTGTTGRQFAHLPTGLVASTSRCAWMTSSGLRGTSASRSSGSTNGPSRTGAKPTCP